MISVGSCNTEDWSIDAENSALIHRDNKIKTFYYIFHQINAALLSISIRSSPIMMKMSTKGEI